MKESVKSILHSARQTIGVTVILMLVCGLLFPCLLTGLSALIFPHQADGNLLTVNGQTVGAEYVGQEFTEDYYMWSRPSAYHYNVYVEGEDGKLYYNDGTEFLGIGSGSNNYAATNPALIERVEADIKAFLEKNPGVKREDIPTDLLTASGSGLDPHISPASAEIQIPRIAEASGLTEEEIEDIVYEEPGDAEAYQDEILAAIESAGHALVCCTMAQEALCRSGNMSVLDLFSKRFMPSLMKHASLAEAEEYIQDAQEALECFNEDLRTILRNEDVKLRHARLCSAIDLWFDSGVMDWFVHLQINRMRRRIGKVIAQVQSIQEELKRLYTA